MISEETMAALEQRGIDYILGARERVDKEVQEIVLADAKPMVAITIPRARGKQTTLEVKEVMVADWGPGSNPRRYVVCYNPEEAKRDAAARAEIVAGLTAKLDQGDKALVANASYRRFLATPREGHFEVDPARVAADARFDGLHVLRTNTKLNTLAVALAYRELWRVEQIFRTAKAILDTRPIFHQADATIAGHLFCSFLALVLRKELDERLAGADLEWGDILRDLDRVEEVTVEQGAKALRAAHRSARLRRPRVQGGRRGPATARAPSASRSAATPARISNRKPPPPWCHAAANFLNYRIRSESSQNQLFNFSVAPLTAACVLAIEGVVGRSLGCAAVGRSYPSALGRNEHLS
jgi:hypothetical protein